jgi:hypothetical protein
MDITLYRGSHPRERVREPAIAAHYLDYWNELSADPAADPLKDWTTDDSGEDAGRIRRRLGEAPGLGALASLRRKLRPPPPPAPGGRKRGTGQGKTNRSEPELPAATSTRVMDQPEVAVHSSSLARIPGRSAPPPSV